MGEDRHDPDDLQRDVQDRVHALDVRLAQYPRSLFGEVGVCIAQNSPDGFERPAELLLFEGTPGSLQQRTGLLQERFVLGRERTGLRNLAVAVLRHHGQGTLGKVAEVVGEVRVHAADDGLVVVVAVSAERNLTEEEVPALVQAVLRHEVLGSNNIAEGLGHLHTVVGEEAVDHDALGQFQSGAHQERRPVDSVEARNVLADHVYIGRPELPEGLGLHVGVTHAGQVVGQGVDPHVHDVLFVTRDRNAPVKGCAADGQVLEATLYEADHLVET
ncbi:hypothetical protein PJL18_01026 [Paenarthrobacter nicotinovorans]|nr:hypothetical protein [Paenarthrobacter nicotinovorans]